MRLFAAIAACLFAAEGRAAEWGDLKMRFVYDGAPPAAKPIAVGAAGAGCGAGPFLEEQLVVDPKDGGIANVCVWLLRTKGDKPPPIHESYDATAKKTVTMTNKNCRFEPRVLVMRTTQALMGLNADKTDHNMKVDFFENPTSFNNNIRPGAWISKSVLVPEYGPTLVKCNFHPWMTGYLLVRDDPYAAISDTHGQLRLANLPAGKRTLVVWHETGYVRAATQAGKPVQWVRGRLTLDIKPGENNLGEFKIKP